MNISAVQRENSTVQHEISTMPKWRSINTETFRAVLLSLLLPKEHIHVTNVFQIEIHLTKLLVLVIFFSFFLFKLLLKIDKPIKLSFRVFKIYH